MYSAVEHVAQAFYYAEGDGQSWEIEPEILKDEFRKYARDVISVLKQQNASALPETLSGIFVEACEAA